MEILIGREEGTHALAFLINGKQRGRDKTCILPNTVSRLKPNENTAHCRLYIKDGNIKIINLNPNNVTYVDGEEVSSAQITEHNIVELGADLFRFNLRKFLKAIGYQKPQSIRHLKRVWEKYDRTLLQLQLDQQKSANQQKLQGIISQLSVLCVIIPLVIPSIPIPAALRVVLVVCAIAIGVYFYLKGNNAENSFVIKKRKLDEQFREDYVCPNCGSFFGFVPYDSLENKKNCPICNCPLST